VFATEQFVELVTIIGPSGTFIAPGGAMNMFLGGALFRLQPRRLFATPRGRTVSVGLHGQRHAGIAWPVCICYV
jgi:hypothetical protein